MTWTPRHTEPTPDYAGQGHIQIGGGHWLALSGPEQVALDDFNSGLPPAGWCPAQTFTDDFESAQSLAEQWRQDLHGSCAAAIVNGMLEISLIGAVLFCGVSSPDLRSLENSSVLVKLPLAPTKPGVRSGLYVQSDSGWVEFSRIEDKLDVYVEQSSGASFDPPEVPNTGYGWLRIRHQPGALLFDARPDGDLEWTNLFAVPTSDSYAAVLIGVAVNDYESSGNSGDYLVANFDNFNLP
jgi:hypothetical protein